MSSTNELLLSLKSFQNKYGAEVMPTEGKVKAEILYNKIDIFQSLVSTLSLCEFDYDRLCNFEYFQAKQTQ